jgi:hypothetical protein
VRKTPVDVAESHPSTCRISGTRRCLSRASSPLNAEIVAQRQSASGIRTALSAGRVSSVVQLPFTREEFFELLADYNVALLPAVAALWVASVLVRLRESGS